jgi:nitrogen PTS system EIIA component
MNLASVLTVDAAFPQLRSVTKKQALKELAARAEKLSGADAGEIFSVLMEREQAGVTAVGEGVAVPRGRLDNLTKTYILAATLSTPIEFGAPDGRPVDILVLLLSPTSANTEHVKAMAAISRLLRDERSRQAIRAAKTPEDLYGVLTHGK